MAKRPRTYSGHSPLTSNPIRHLDFRIQEIPIDQQISKLKKSAEKNQKQVDKAREQAAREPSQRARLEAKALRIEALVNFKLLEIQMLLRRGKTQEKREQTQKENLKAEMQAHIKNLEKIKPVFNPKSRITPTQQGNIEQVFGRQKPDTRRVGNTVKSVRKKRFAKT